MEERLIQACRWKKGPEAPASEPSVYLRRKRMARVNTRTEDGKTQKTQTATAGSYGALVHAKRRDQVLAVAVKQSAFAGASATKGNEKRECACPSKGHGAPYLRPSWAISIVSIEISFLLAS